MWTNETIFSLRFWCHCRVNEYFHASNKSKKYDDAKVKSLTCVHDGYLLRLDFITAALSLPEDRKSAEAIVGSGSITTKTLNPIHQRVSDQCHEGLSGGILNLFLFFGCISTARQPLTHFLRTFTRSITEFEISISTKYRDEIRNRMNFDVAWFSTFFYPSKASSVSK